MRRIDEIMTRIIKLVEGKETGSFDKDDAKEFFTSSPSDIMYLVQCIGRYEKALKEIEKITDSDAVKKIVNDAFEKEGQIVWWRD
jgi:hypothetical protein